MARLIVNCTLLNFDRAYCWLLTVNMCQRRFVFCGLLPYCWLTHLWSLFASRWFYITLSCSLLHPLMSLTCCKGHILLDCYCISCCLILVAANANMVDSSPQPCKVPSRWALSYKLLGFEALNFISIWFLVRFAPKKLSHTKPLSIFRANEGWV